MDKIKFQRRISYRIRTCTLCKAVVSPGVPPEGDINSPVFLCGRNPGIVESRKGRPFIGPGGILLDSELDRIGFPRSYFRVLNLMNCYTQGDRPPTDEEIKNCRPYLLAQIKVLQPRLIVTMGKQATGAFTEKVNWAELRGRPFKWREVWVVPVTHPGQALRGAGRAPMYQDFNQLGRYLQVLLKM